MPTTWFKYLFSVLFLLISLFSQAQSTRLIIRSDDMGFSHAANQAIIETCEQGITTSIEIMVPTPWFPEAVKMLREHPDLDVGVHLTLTSEWENVKWKPLTHAPSLTDERGYFYPMIWPNDNYGKDQALQPQNWKLEEIERELRAQIEMAKREIPALSHVSGHMGCNRMDDRVDALVNKLAKEYGLDISLEALEVQRASYKGPKATKEEKISSFIAMLESLSPGTYLFVDHPAYDVPEVQAVYHIGYTDVASDRQGVTDLLTSDEVKEAVKRLNIQLVSYADLADK
uniref:Polysaccharide deacetylase family protein n=1 Tax=Roseihalotalea indica TaxID=2867963 RepID=A0AA49GPL8_9BACT|nr:polysaccharide deacetylase family protein [Tunicatimonas sp. TK19036]